MTIVSTFIFNFMLLPIQDKANGHKDVQNQECCSHSSSNRESWGRCSSLGGGSEESTSAEVPGVSDTKEQVSSCLVTHEAFSSSWETRGFPNCFLLCNLSYNTYCQLD